MNPFERGSTKHVIKPFRFFCYASALVSLLLLLVSPVKLVTVKESSIKAKRTENAAKFSTLILYLLVLKPFKCYKISRVCRGKRRVEHTHSFCHACSDKIPTCYRPVYVNLVVSCVNKDILDRITPCRFNSAL